MFDRPDSGDKTLLVHVGTKTVEKSADEISEFTELAVSANLHVCELVTGHRAKPEPRHFVGSGKLEEIRVLVQMHEVDLVLFNQRLAPSQERNLESVLGVRVLDRTSLILDIFAQRARTFEGKLQVELAQLEHLSTRLVRGWTHLERQKGGIGLRGPGETQLETDRRLLSARVSTIKRRLERVRKQRAQGRQARTRSGTATVALVGYTNAGKSTLFNQLTNDNVYAADKMFATLDPTLRRLPLAGGRHVVLADTVGFISNLPHELVDAFQSTLIETRESSLLLHIVDASDEERQARMNDVDSVLKEIGANRVSQLIVYNKIDITGRQPLIERDELGKPVSVSVSALRNTGMDLLKSAIVELTGDSRICGWLTLQPSEGKIRALLFEAEAITTEIIDDDGSFRCQIDIDQSLWENYLTRFDIASRFIPDTEPLAAVHQAQ